MWNTTSKPTSPEVDVTGHAVATIPPPLPPRPRTMVCLCHTCGQFHEPHVAHLYDYYQTVDEDLTCAICLQPLVDPLDTRCGHTFCAKCLRSYLKVQSACPVDSHPVTLNQVQQSSLIVKRLLDKILVVCPNVDYCEEILPRCDLEAHLAHRCKGAVTKCMKAEFGCTFQGPRSALQSHLWECHFRDVSSGSPSLLRAPVVEGEVSTVDIQRGCYDLGFAIVGGIDTPLLCTVVQEIFPEGVAAKDGRLQPGDQLLEYFRGDLPSSFDHYFTRHGDVHNYNTRFKGRLVIPKTRTLARQKSIKSAGIKLWESLPEDIRCADKVNGIDLTSATHFEAKEALSQVYPICRLTVYRERADEYCPIEKEEILKVLLTKIPGRQLGMKLVGKKNEPGLYVMEMIPGSIAALDGRLKKDDKILEINCQDMSYATQELAAQLIQSSADRVHFVVSRRSRPQTPDIIRSTSRECLLNCSVLATGSFLGYPFKQCKQKIASINKEPAETLGISVAGGQGNPRGDIPIYITNIQPDGCLGRSGLIKKGDVLVSVNGNNLLDLNHSEAVAMLKTCAEAKSVCLKLLDGPESCEGLANFSPSWKFWLAMPPMCYSLSTITLDRTPSGTLGFSIVGGSNGGHGTLPVYVKSVVPKTPAGKDGRLRSGDMLLSANGQTLESVSHNRAVSLLKGNKGTVTLKVVSWPGSSV